MCGQLLPAIIFSVSMGDTAESNSKWMGCISWLSPPLSPAFDLALGLDVISSQVILFLEGDLSQFREQLFPKLKRGKKRNKTTKPDFDSLPVGTNDLYKALFVLEATSCFLKNLAMTASLDVYFCGHWYGNEGEGQRDGEDRPGSWICRRADTGGSFITRMAACALSLDSMGMADEVRLQMLGRSWEPLEDRLRVHCLQCEVEDVQYSTCSHNPAATMLKAST